MKKTIVVLLNAISKSPDCLVDIGSFKYRRISRPSVQVGVASAADKAKLVAGIAAAATAAEVQEVAEAAAKLAYEKSHLVFSRTADFLPVSGVGFNDRRANAVATFMIPGTVAMPSDCPDGVPKDFPTSVVRNFAFVVDGRLHIESLRARLSTEAAGFAAECGVKLEEISSGCYDMDLSGVPLFDDEGYSDGMPSADQFVDDAWELIRLSAMEKSVRHYLDEASGLAKGPSSSGMAAKYGVENAQYLAELGITDSGFSPKSAAGEPRDRQEEIELAVKFKGFSSLPSVNAVLKKLSDIENDLAAAGRTRKTVTPSENFVLERMNEVLGRKDAMAGADFVEWAKGQCDEIDRAAGDIRERMANTRIAVVGGGRKFREWDSDHGVVEKDGRPTAEVCRAVKTVAV